MLTDFEDSKLQFVARAIAAKHMPAGILRKNAMVKQDQLFREILQALRDAVNGKHMRG